MSLHENAPYITISNDKQILFSVPADLNCISTYVLLEQGRWFEKEIDFIYRYVTPGMTALDIGANIGVYTLSLATRVGQSGQVVAYEPGTVNRRHLERCLTINHCSNVTVSDAALSDFSGRGWLKIGESGELNQLVPLQTDSEIVEPVEVTTLDTELDRFNWAQVDFVKIDAEGSEEAVLKGGRRFLKRYSPLIMIEITHGATTNLNLIETFQALGFGIFRLLGDGSMLVATGRMEKIDCFELNLFAARPDQANRIAKLGLLASPGGTSELSTTEQSAAIAFYCALPFAQALEIGPADVDQCPFRGALVAYSAYRFLPSLSPDRRLALLQMAYAELLAYCQENRSAAALSSLSRVAHDLGHRETAHQTLLRYFSDTELIELDQPFFPPSERFEGNGSTSANDWFLYAITEMLELRSSYSSLFCHDMSRLKWLAEHESVSDEILRRLVLVGLRVGMPKSEIVGYLSRLRYKNGMRNEDWHKTVQSLMASI